jgi:hypothetical protein
MTDAKPGECEIEGCKRLSDVVVNRQGEWKAVCSFHNAPKHWNLKEDFDATPSLFGAKKGD